MSWKCLADVSSLHLGRQHAAVKQSCPPHFEAEQKNSSGCFAAPPFPIEGM